MIQMLNVDAHVSDTVPLWSGSSFSAFVYIGNDGCIICSWL